MVNPEKNIVLSYSKNKGFGRTKAFIFRIFDDNSVVFEGLRNVPLGKQIAKLSEIQFTKLQILLANCEFEKLDTNYLTQIRDLQRIIIQYNSFEIILHHRKAPASLKELIRHLNNLIMELTWE